MNVNERRPPTFEILDRQAHGIGLSAIDLRTAVAVRESGSL
jgi:hypothetical protein